MKIKHFLQLIRYKNVLMVVFMIILFSFTLTEVNSPEYFNTFLLIISVSSITIAGNIINDYYDVEIDEINKPNKLIISKYITKEKSILFYVYFNAFGIVSSLYLASQTDKYVTPLIVIFTAILLFIYSKYLKKYAIIGNLIVSLLIGLSIFIVAISLPTVKNTSTFLMVLTFAFLAFFINFIRELVKDIEDIDGDYANNLKTLPILIGKKRTQHIIAFLSSFYILFILYIIFKLLNFQILKVYLFITIILPLLYFTYKIVLAKTKKQFHNLSTLLKIMMLFGLLSVLILNFF